MENITLRFSLFEDFADRLATPNRRHARRVTMPLLPPNRKDRRSQFGSRYR
jgi:hypothetical protein